MKKIKIISIILIIIGFIGLGAWLIYKRTINKKEEHNLMLIENKKEELEEKLLEYGKLVYENDGWLNSELKEGTYYMTLKELNEKNGYDISMFTNPITNVECNKNKTRIEFVFEGLENEEFKYHYNTYLECDF